MAIILDLDNMALTSYSYLDDGFCQRVCDDLEQFGGVFSGLEMKRIDDEFGDFVQNACGSFQRQKNQDRKPVEEVVDCSTSKCPEKQEHSV